eukprot:m.25341 g.25341  ORF g.25341 m.25341 type:complete len:239 (+) comp11588_c0_seq1:36-752(+)
MDALTLAIVAAVVVVLAIGAFVAFGLKKAVKKDKVLLLGCKGAGKTTLFLRLVHQLFNKKTTTSIEVNEASYQLNDDTTIRIVDIPGHPRLAENLLNEHAVEAQALVFIIDSAVFNKDVRQVAELLYTVLTHPSLVDIPVLLLCNKQDIVTAAKNRSVVAKLEKELTQLRTTARTSVGDTAGEDDQGPLELGDETTDAFKFEQLSNRIDFEETSLKDQSEKCQASDNIVLNWMKQVIA